MPVFSFGLSKKRFFANAIFLSVMFFVILIDMFLKIKNDSSIVSSSIFIVPRIIFFPIVLLAILRMAFKIERKYKRKFSLDDKNKLENDMEKWIRKDLKLPDDKLIPVFDMKNITLKINTIDYIGQHSILNDYLSKGILDMLNIDYTDMSPDDGWGTIIRAKQIDEWIKEYIAENKNVTVINSECGLDTRIWRINPPTTVHWFDMDFLPIIEVRKLIYRDNECYYMQGNPLFAIDWSENFSGNIPVLIISEDNLFYLKTNELELMLNAVTTYFNKGQLIFSVLDPEAERHINGENGFSETEYREKIKNRINLVNKYLQKKTVLNITKSPFFKKKVSIDRRPFLRNRNILTFYRFEWGHSNAIK